MSQERTNAATAAAATPSSPQRLPTATPSRRRPACTARRHATRRSAPVARMKGRFRMPAMRTAVPAARFWSTGTAASHWGPRTTATTDLGRKDAASISPTGNPSRDSSSTPVEIDGAEAVDALLASCRGGEQDPGHNRAGIAPHGAQRRRPREMAERLRPQPAPDDGATALPRHQVAERERREFGAGVEQLARLAPCEAGPGEAWPGRNDRRGEDGMARDRAPDQGPDAEPQRRHRDCHEPRSRGAATAPPPRPAP